MHVAKAEAVGKQGFGSDPGTAAPARPHTGWGTPPKDGTSASGFQRQRHVNSLGPQCQGRKRPVTTGSAVLLAVTGCT